MSVSDTYVFVASSETTLLKYWCLPVEIFDDLELYINQTRVWSDWEILFRKLGRKSSLSDGVIGADEVAEVARVVKRLGDHVSLMPEGPSKRLKQHAIREQEKEKYPRDYLIAVDPDEEVLPSHINGAKQRKTKLRKRQRISLTYICIYPQLATSWVHVMNPPILDLSWNI